MAKTEKGHGNAVFY